MLFIRLNLKVYLFYTIITVHLKMGLLSSFQICTFLKGASVHLIEDQKVPYAIKQNEWVGYDDKDSFHTKVCFSKDVAQLPSCSTKHKVVP